MCVCGLVEHAVLVPHAQSRFHRHHHIGFAHQGDGSILWWASQRWHCQPSLPTTRFQHMFSNTHVNHILSFQFRCRSPRATGFRLFLTVTCGARVVVLLVACSHATAASSCDGSTHSLVSHALSLVAWPDRPDIFIKTLAGPQSVASEQLDMYTRASCNSPAGGH